MLYCFPRRYYNSKSVRTLLYYTPEMEKVLLLLVIIVSCYHTVCRYLPLRKVHAARWRFLVPSERGTTGRGKVFLWMEWAARVSFMGRRSPVRGSCFNEKNLDRTILVEKTILSEHGLYTPSWCMIPAGGNRQRRHPRFLFGIMIIANVSCRVLLITTVTSLCNISSSDVRKKYSVHTEIIPRRKRSLAG